MRDGTRETPHRPPRLFSIHLSSRAGGQIPRVGYARALAPGVNYFDVLEARGGQGPVAGDSAESPTLGGRRRADDTPSWADPASSSGCSDSGDVGGEEVDTVAVEVAAGAAVVLGGAWVGVPGHDLRVL